MHNIDSVFHTTFEFLSDITDVVKRVHVNIVCDTDKEIIIEKGITEFSMTIDYDENDNNETEYSIYIKDSNYKRISYDILARTIGMLDINDKCRKSGKSSMLKSSSKYHKLMNRYIIRASEYKMIAIYKKRNDPIEYNKIVNDAQKSIRMYGDSEEKSLMKDNDRFLEYLIVLCLEFEGILGLVRFSSDSEKDFYSNVIDIVMSGTLDKMDMDEMEYLNSQLEKAL